MAPLGADPAATVVAARPAASRRQDSNQRLLQWTLHDARRRAAVVAEGRGTTCFVRTRKPDGSVVWTAAGPISLNGVQLMPSGVIRFDQKLSNLVMQMPAGTTLGFGSFTWTVPSSISFDLTTHFVMPNPNGEFEIAGLTVAAQPDFSLSTADGGSATVTLNLELPEIFQGAAGDESEEPQGAKGLTFAFKFIASNQKGVRFAFKGSLSSAPGCSERSSSQSSPSGWTPGHR